MANTSFVPSWCDPAWEFAGFQASAESARIAAKLRKTFDDMPPLASGATALDDAALYREFGIRLGLVAWLPPARVSWCLLAVLAGGALIRWRAAWWPYLGAFRAYLGLKLSVWHDSVAAAVLVPADIGGFGGLNEACVEPALEN